MRDVSTIHPDLRTLARVLPSGGNPLRGLAVQRRAFALWNRRPRRGVTLQRVGDVLVRVHQPSVPSGAAVLWVHGGGYVSGSPVQDDAFCHAVANATGAVVAAPAYRLAPEDPYPAGLDDCHQVLQWLVHRPGVDASRVAVAGASAGGGLAAALALRCRDAREPAVAFQLLVYPMLDDRTIEREPPRGQVTRMWEAASNRIGWGAYLGPDAADGGGGYLAAPGRCQDLAGSAPAWIGVGTADLFHDEDVAFAERLRSADVACTLEIIPGAFHGFDAISRSNISKSFRASQVAALKDALAPQGH